jgi:glycine oxidase
VQRSDAIIIGAGIIGLSLALELDRRGLKVRVIDKGEPGREASWAAGGMLADFPLEMPAALHELAHASARMYPDFARGLEDKSGAKIDLRDQGTLVLLGERLSSATQLASAPATLWPLPEPLESLEPALSLSDTACRFTPLFLRESSVDPRQLTAAALSAARHRGIEISSGDPVIAITLAKGKTAGGRTEKARFAAGVVVNCAGAWAGQIRVEDAACSSAAGSVPSASSHISRESHIRGGPHPSTGIAIPTRPVKGQMLCVVMPHKEFSSKKSQGKYLLTHVVRTPDVYLIPRSDGRLLIGATHEEAGFDKQTVPETLARLRQAAVQLVPQLAEATLLESWAGLRPGTPDAIPILGATSVPGYFVATGHFRDGILLAPVTARMMGKIICGEEPGVDLNPFAAARFGA